MTLAMAGDRMTRGDAGSLRAEWNIYLLTYNNRYHQEETLLENFDKLWTYINNKLDLYTDPDIYLHK